LKQKRRKQIVKYCNALHKSVETTFIANILKHHHQQQQQKQQQKRNQQQLLNKNCIQTIES